MPVWPLQLDRMAATAQNHMEPLRGDEKKDDEYEDERRLLFVIVVDPSSETEERFVFRWFDLFFLYYS